MSKRLKYHRKYEEGFSIKMLALEFNVSQIEVVKTLRSGNPKIQGANYKHLKIPIDLEELGYRYLADELSEYAKELGVSEVLLRSRVPDDIKERKMKVKKERKKSNTRYGREMTPDRIEQANAVYATTNNIKETARQTGCSVHFVRRAIEESSQRISAEYLVLIYTEMFKLINEGKISSESAEKLSHKLKELPRGPLLAWEGMIFRWFRESVITMKESETIMSVLEGLE
jgi:protein tyrosine/serine phosphatase